MLNSVYNNPDNKPLNELFCTISENGISTKYSLLNEKWVSKRCHTKYTPLPLNEGHIVEGAALEEWISESDWFNKEMELLLEMEYYRFWSSMVYDQGCIDAVVSFLQEAIPFYINILNANQFEFVMNTYNKIMQNTLRVICRLITNKENDNEWMSKEYLAELLYNQFLISVPMIFDLAIAYGRKNLSILTRIIDTIIKIEPKYIEDLREGLQFIQQTFKVITDKLEKNNFIHDGNMIPILVPLATMLNDLTFHGLDSAATLSILLEMDIKTIKQLCIDIKMSESISHFYDTTIPELYKSIYTLNSDAYSLYYLNCTRIELITSYNLIISLLIDFCLNRSEKLLNCENYLNVITNSISDRSFIIDYQKFYPIENDLNVLNQMCKNLDNFKINFIKAAFLEKKSKKFEKTSATKITNGFNGVSKKDNISDQMPSTSSSIKQNDNINNLRSIENEIETILNVFPDYGDGYVRKLLERYENPEAVIAAVLEDNLPPDLELLDKSEPYIPIDPQDITYLETGVRHLNVFDGDDYDIMTNDKPKCIVKIGKGFPGQPKNLKTLLDDKTHVNEMRERYQQYSMVTVGNTNDDDDENLYDDEYDDSYDALAESESKTVKLAAFKNVVMDDIEDESEDEADVCSEEDTTVNSNSKRAFCINPEILRAQYEAKRNLGRPKNRDLVGKPKGQGQSKEVTVNRYKKGVYKAIRGNQNRKQNSNRKQSKGMI